MNIKVHDALPFIDEHTFEATRKDVLAAHEALLNKTIKGSDFLGWVKVEAVDETTL